MSDSNLITVRLSQSERAKLVKLAEEKGSTLSAVAREAITTALKHGDLETRLAVAVQAEMRALTDDFLNHYYAAQEGAAALLKAAVVEIAGTTKQAINPPKLDMTAQAIRDIQERARVQGRELSQAERVDIARLQGHRPAHVPGAPD